MNGFGNIKQLIEKVASSIVTYINFENTELERDSTITTVDTTINEIHKNIEHNAKEINEYKKILSQGGFNYKSAESGEQGKIITKLFETMSMYQNEIEWRSILIDILHTYMEKYYEALEGAKGISQSSALIDKQQTYLTTLFDNMKEVFKDQVESGFEQRKLEFGALLQRFEFLTDRIRVNDVILNKCIDAGIDQKNEISSLAKTITDKYEIQRVYTCSTCWKELNSKKELEEHMKTHQFKSAINEIKEEKQMIEQNKETLEQAEQKKIAEKVILSQESTPDLSLTVDEKIGQGFNTAMIKEKEINQDSSKKNNMWDEKEEEDELEKIKKEEERKNKTVEIQPNKSDEDMIEQIKKDKEDEKVKRKHLKMLGKELKKSLVYKNKVVEYLIKQNKYNDIDIMTIADCAKGLVIHTHKQLNGDK